MARTVKPKVKPKSLPTVVKAIDYNGGTIAKMSDGTMQAIYKENIEEVEGRSEGQEFIDSCIRKASNPQRSQRTKGGIKTKTESGKTPSGPHVGYMKNPPEDCGFAVRDQFKEIWVDVYFCAYKCDKRIDCKVAALLQEGRKERIRHDS